MDELRTSIALEKDVWVNQAKNESGPLRKHMCACAVTLVMTDSLQPHGLCPLRSSSIGFSRQEQWSGLPCLPPGDLPDPGKTCVSYVSCIGSWVLHHFDHMGSISYMVSPKWSSLKAQMVMNLPARQETWVKSLGQEDPLEKGMATQSSILVWRFSWTKEPGGHSPWSCRVRHNWTTDPHT